MEKRRKDSEASEMAEAITVFVLNVVAPHMVERGAKDLDVEGESPFLKYSISIHVELTEKGRKSWEQFVKEYGDGRNGDAMPTTH